MNAKAVVRGLAVVLLLGVPLAAQGQAVDFQQEPACQTLTSTGMGGPAPKSPNLMVLRYLGSSNHEIAYRDTVILLNAHYARVWPARSLGFTRDQMTNVDAILIGHGHGDHMSDAPHVAQRTGAMLVGAPITAEQAKVMGLAEKQIVAVTGRGQAGEVKTFGAITVEPMLARHGGGQDKLDEVSGPAYRQFMDAAGLVRTPAQQEEARKAAPGSRDPRITDEGTISYLLTFGNDFRLMFRDTSGVDATGEGTEAERRVMQRVGGRTNVAIVSYSTVIPEAQLTTMPLLRLYRPDVYLPTHHDQVAAGRLDTPLEPLFLRLRDEMPNIMPISPLYKTPVCFDTQTKAVYYGVMAR